ncbi:vWA domain-containing protein [Streptomyces varsoviensis]|uniref:vWA domain-containing protein n=1 Tax=Streptomyces varsoviensis TaxID=67373 RepID=UPI000996FFC4|nr:VWA domain-containing protein [Streptomyces varsoviensis]
MTIDYTKRPAAPRIDYTKRRATPAPTPTSPPASASASASAPAPAPAIDLTKVQAAAPKLLDLYKSARISLEKAGMAGRRAAVYLVLDRSGSMRGYYKDGSVQHLAERALGLSANLDDDGTVPVVFFSTEVDGIAELGLDDYEGRVNALHDGYGHMGRTNYHLAMQAVIDHYAESGATDPAFVVFQTDGGPSSRAAAEHVLCTAAKLPIFWQFVAFGDPEDKQFAFLRRLDELPVPTRRVIDNAGFFAAGRNPRSLSDSELYHQLTREFSTWLTAATDAGIIR